MRKPKYTVAIVDDELDATGVLQILLQHFSFLELVYKESDAVRAFRYFNENHVDMLFLDIEMPMMDGISLVKMLAVPPVVTVCTAHDHYGYEASEINAIAYIAKMPVLNRLKEVVLKMVEEVDRRLESNMYALYIEIMDVNKRRIKIDVDDIQYVESHDKTISVVTVSGTYQTQVSLRSLVKLLPKNEFAYANRSTLLSLAKVAGCDSKAVNLNGTKRNFTFGREFRQRFMASLEYCRIRYHDKLR